jgi:RNA polymerase sigma-70 factor (ECF subfamily)
MRDIRIASDQATGNCGSATCRDPYKAIDQASENLRVASYLNKYEDLSYQEIAEVREMSLSSVESLIHRAKKNLQKQLYDCYKKKCL